MEGDKHEPVERDFEPVVALQWIQGRFVPISEAVLIATAV